MNYLAKLLILVLYSLLITEITKAQDLSPLLFNIPSELNIQTKSNSKFGVDTTIIDLNFNLFERIKKEQVKSIRIVLDDQKEYLVRLNKVSVYFNGDWSISGYFDNNLSNIFTLSYSEDKVLSSIENLSSNEYYKILYSKKGDVHVLIKIEPNQTTILNCGTTEIHMHNTPKWRGDKTKDYSNAINDEITEIDLMVVYTRRAREWAESDGGIQNIIYQSIAKGQIALENSDVGVKINLVYFRELDYEESELSYGSPDVDINRLIASPDFNPFGDQYAGYLDEVHQMRDEYNADLVSFFIKTDQVGGLGWVLNDPGGNDRFGFSLTRVQQANTLSHIHEIAHNFGNGHSRLQNSSPAGPLGGLFLYSTGWRWLGSDNQEYSSVMTYGEGATPVPFFRIQISIIRVYLLVLI